MKKTYLNRLQAGGLMVVFLLGGILQAEDETIEPVEMEEAPAVDTLYIRVIDSIIPMTRDRWTSDAFENDRYHHFTQVVRDVFEQAEYPAELVFKRFGARIPEDVVSVDMTLVAWEQTRLPLEFECRFFATIRKDGEVVELGVFRGSDSSLRSARQRDYRSYTPAATKAVENFYETYVKVMRMMHTIEEG